MRIQSNIPAMNAGGLLGVNAARQAKSIEKLSSGRRVNRSADDAAGLAISEKMRAQIRGLNQANRNIHDGVNLLQTAEGALQSVCDIIQRMREIAVQAASDTNENMIDRAALDKEYQQLKREIDDFAGKTEFNGRKLIDGSFEKDKFSHFIEFLYAYTAGIGQNAPIPMVGNAEALSATITPRAPLVIADWQPAPTAPVAPTAPAAPAVIAPVNITPDGPETYEPDHISIDDPLHIIADDANVGDNNSILYITGDGAKVDNNNANLGITGDGAGVDNNNANLDVIGDSARITINDGSVKINGYDAGVTNNNSALEITGDAASVVGNRGTARINGDYANIQNNFSGGNVEITGDNAAIGNNNTGGNADIFGDGARVATNDGTVRVSGNGAGVTRNNNRLDITGHGANITGNYGIARIGGDNAVVQTNYLGGTVEITGNSGRVATNNGTTSIAGDNGTVSANYGIADIIGDGARVDNNYAGGVARLFGGPGGNSSVGTNNANGSVYVAQTTGSFTIGINSGRLVTRSQTVTITNNTANSTARISDAAIVRVATNAGSIEVINSPGNTDFALTSVNSGRISTDAGYNRIVGNTGEIVVTGGEIDLSGSITNSGTITIMAGAAVTGQGAVSGNIFGTNTMQGRIQIEGPGSKLSGAGARISVASGATLDLYSGAVEYISANNGNIYARDAGSRADVTTSSGYITAFNQARTDVGTNSGRVDVSNNSAANIGTNNGSAYAYDNSVLNIGTNNNGRLVKINANSSVTININNGGRVEANNGGSVSITGANGWNFGEVLLFEDSRADIDLNGRNTGAGTVGWVEINKDAAATITTNDGYIRNFNISLSAAIVMENTANGIIDNYGRMEVGSNAVTDNLRHHVYEDSGDAGCPPGGIDTSGIKPLFTNGVLPKEAQYLTVYANGQSYTLEAYWVEVPHQECNLDDNGIVNPDVNCNDKIFQLVFSGETDDGGRITFDSNNAYIVSGTQYGIRLDNNSNSVWPYELHNPYSPYPDVPNDSSIPPDSSNRSGFYLVYQALVRQESVYKEGTPLVIQSGPNEGDATPIWLSSISTATLGYKADGSNVFEICGCQTLRESKVININFARRAIKISDAALVQVASMRAVIGAQQNRLEYKLGSVDISAENLQNAESRIRDVDMAKEMMEFTRNNILNRSSTAMLAQANALPQSVLRVLGSAK